MLQFEPSMVLLNVMVVARPRLMHVSSITKTTAVNLVFHLVITSLARVDNNVQTLAKLCIEDNK